MAEINFKSNITDDLKAEAKLLWDTTVKPFLLKWKENVHGTLAFVARLAIDQVIHCFDKLFGEV